MTRRTSPTMRRGRMARLSCCLLLWLWAPMVLAQTFEFAPPPTVEDAATPAAMRDLAVRLLPVYQDPDIQRYLATLSILQLVAGNDQAAADTRQTLQQRRRHIDAGHDPGTGRRVDLYASARSIAVREQRPYADALAQVFRDTAAALSDQQAYQLGVSLRASAAPLRDPVQRAFEHARSQRNSLNQAEALELIRAYLAYEAQRSFTVHVAPLIAEDDAKRYRVDAALTIPVGGKRTLQAYLLRPRDAGAARRVATLLEFTVGPGAIEAARASAAHGYAGLMVTARDSAVSTAGKSLRPMPFQTEDDDARAVMRWVARQTWSDGRVGITGSGYGAVAAWMTARKPPPQLAAIAISDPMVPGINFPMEGRVMNSSALRWLSDFARGGSDPAADTAWAAVDRAWFRSGKPYTALERQARVDSAAWRTWLTHPSFDRYWQNRLPTARQFAQLAVPVLNISGYYADAGIGAGWLFEQHRRQRPQAEHRWLIGPYTDAAQPEPVLRGLAVDAAALIDTRELRLQWFDHVLGKAPLPTMLRDAVNVQLAGANQWRHAGSVDALSSSRMRLHLVPPEPGRERGALRGAAPAVERSHEQRIALADRRDAPLPPPPALLTRQIDAASALVYVSDPLAQPTDVAGRIAGMLDFTINRMDIDLSLALYELSASGDYLLINDPYEWRASYAADPRHRRLLQAGVRQQLPFRSEALSVRRIAVGSRLVLVVGVIRRADRPTNYGSARDVKEVAASDMRSPMKIRWYSSSYVDLPLIR